ncbi:MAG: HD-GYP domain-containing protein [Gammaproteobacteria bacterium]|nr:HD-GYP domain-containing protein [Gammaproteobacteria bacterium]
MLKQTKVFVEDIQLGMYVSQLDRPWVETPFLFQGFYINSPREIEQLGQYCEYVYIDEEQSRTTVSPKRVLAAPATKLAKPESVQRLNTPRDLGDFRQQLNTAIKVHENTKLFITRVMHDIRLGKNVDIKQAKQLVSELAENVVKNPTALLWLTQLKNKDEYTSLHSLNVCVLSLFFGRSLNLPEEQLHTLGLGALLHDVGKLKVPTEVLNKPGRLSTEEFGVMKQHTVFGYELMKNRGELSNNALDIIIQHHERLDGSGYPYNLGHGQISHFSKLVSIVDVYDAITSKRVYHEETTPFNALNDIYKHREKEFDANLVEQFIKCLGIYPIGSLVELNTGQVGVVVFFSEKSHLSPTIMLILDEQKTPYHQFRYVNLGSTVWEKHNQKPEIKRIADPAEFGLDLADIIFKESLHLAFGW